MNFLIRLGYVPSPHRTASSHVKFEKEGCRPIPVVANSTIADGTLRGIIKQAGITLEDFWQIWDELR